MKKSTLAVIMIATIMVGMFSGCGKASGTNAGEGDISGTTQEVVEKEPTLRDLKETDEGAVYEALQRVDYSVNFNNFKSAGKFGYVNKYKSEDEQIGYLFPDGRGFINQSIDDEDPTIAFTQIFFQHPNGDVISLSLELPVGNGYLAYVGEDTLFLKDETESYFLRVWTVDITDEADYLNNIESFRDGDAIITNWNSDMASVILEGVVTLGESTELDVVVSNDKYSGAVKFLDDNDNAKAYQCMYLEASDVYDEDRAKGMVDYVFLKMEEYQTAVEEMGDNLGIDEVEHEHTYAYKVTADLDSGAAADGTMYIWDDNTTMCDIEVSTTLPNGTVMNFECIGDVGLFDSFLDNGDGLVEIGNEDRSMRLRAWLGKRITENSIDYLIENSTVEYWLTNDSTSRADEYFEADATEDKVEIIYAIGYEEEGKSYKGYAKYVAERIDEGLPFFYQWSYVEEASIYDEARVLGVVESLEIMAE